MLGAPVFRTALFGPWSGNALWTAARAVPSLDLCFADKKDLICASSGRQLVTFARASSGTYVDSAGVLQTAATDVPRFDHNPLTGESLGLLVEEQRTNLLLRSEEFNDAYWSKTLSSVSANSTNSPASTQTADTLVEDTSNGEHQITGFFTLTSGTIYTVSIYVKAAGRTFCRFGFTGTGFSGPTRSTFNLATGAVTTNNGGSPTITPVGSGWYRLSVTNTATSTTSGSFIIQPQLDASTLSYTGDGTSGIFLWAAQLEAGAFATSYIPTTTAAATRNADVVQITGTNFSSWYRQDEGTLYAEYIIPALIADGTVTSFDDGTANNRWQQRFSTISQRYRLVSGGVSLIDDASTGAPLVNAANKVAHTIRSGDQRYAGNGALNTNIVTASPLPTVTQLQIGAGPAAGSAGRIIIRRLVYWPQRLDNATLQAITQP